MLKTKYRKLSEIKCLEGNPRTINEDSFKKLCTSIENNPQYFEARPIILSDRTGEFVSIAGNQRVKAAKHLKLKEVPTILIPNLTEAKEREIIIRDNVSNGDWDVDILESDWDMEELEDWGLDLDFEEEELEAKEDDYQEPETMQVDIVLGDLIEFVCDDGRVHRLLCGDSTCSDSVGKLMDGERADMVFTDPPYLMNFDGGMTTNKDGNWTKSFNSKHGGIKNDKMKKSKESDFLDSINSNIRLHTKGAFYICFYRLKLGDYFASMERTGLKTRTLITWNKGNHTMSNSDYWSKCEHIFYGWIKEHNWYGGNDYDIWEIQRTQKNDLHPTMKPIPLCEKAIINSSKQNNIVFDLFLGSGSTMAAAHQLKRTCYGMELDEKYCQVIIDRMTKLDETLTVKINGKEYKKEGEGVPF